MSVNGASLSELGIRFGLPMGWGQGNRDPWLNWRSFYQWLKDSWKPEGEREIFLITAQSRGSKHLAYLCYLTCSQVDFPSLTPKQLQSMVWLGVMVEDGLRRMGVPTNAYDGDLINYEEDLHPNYIRYLLQQTLPFKCLWEETEVAFMKRLAVDEQVRRGYDFAFEKYIVSESPRLQNRLQEIAPSNSLPDKDAAFEKLIARVRSKLRRRDEAEDTAQDQYSIYNFLQKLVVRGYDEEPPSSPGVSEARRQVSLLQEAAHAGKLSDYLSTVAWHDWIDGIRKGARQDDHEGLENQYENLLYYQWIEQGYPAPESEDRGQVRLEDLNLPLDKLTRGEEYILQEVREAHLQGYSRSSKQGKSLKDYWGQDYPRKIKALERAKGKLRLK